MTISCAVKKKGKVFIGSDSFWGDNSFQYQGSDLGKIIEMNGFMVAMAGVANLRDVLEEIKDQNRNHSMVTKKDARDFMKEVFERSKRMLYEGNTPQSNQEHEFSNGSTIIATPDTIFNVQADLSVFIQDRYYAIGAGEYYASAVLEFAHDSKSSGRAILQGALETACKLSPFCCGPLDIREVK